MNATNSPSSTKPELAPPLPADLSERIWMLHRTITDPTVKRSTVKDAKRALLGALIVHNQLRNIPIPPISKRARASSSSFRANHFKLLAPALFTHRDGHTRPRRRPEQQSLLSVIGALS